MHTEAIASDTKRTAKVNRYRFSCIVGDRMCLSAYQQAYYIYSSHQGQTISSVVIKAQGLCRYDVI